MASNSGTYTLSVVKYKNNKTLWNKTFPSFYGPYFINSFDEDDQKNVVFTISPKNGPGGYHTNYTNYCFKIDSNGYHNGTYNVLLNYSWWPPVSLFESVKVHYLKNKTYFYDIILYNFPSNPLSISLLDTSLLSECSTILPINMANIPPQTIYNLPRNIIVNDDSNFLFTNNNIITNFVTSFNTNTNYCLALNTQNINIKSEVTLSPNPAQNILNINTSSNSLIIESHIYDIDGKIVLKTAFSHKIDISTIKPSIYFIKIKTDKGEFSQNFIKE